MHKKLNMKLLQINVKKIDFFAQIFLQPDSSKRLALIFMY